MIKEHYGRIIPSFAIAMLLTGVLAIVLNETTGNYYYHWMWFVFGGIGIGFSWYFIHRVNKKKNRNIRH